MKDYFDNKIIVNVETPDSVQESSIDSLSDNSPQGKIINGMCDANVNLHPIPIKILASFSSNFTGKRKKIVASILTILDKELTIDYVITKLSMKSSRGYESFPWTNVLIIHHDSMYNFERGLSYNFPTEFYRYNVLSLKNFIEGLNNQDSVRVNKVLSERLLLFVGYEWKDIVNVFHDNGLDLSGGHTSFRHLLSVNQYKISIASYFLRLTKFDIGSNFHKNSYKDKTEMPLTRNEKIIKLLRERLSKVSNKESYTRKFSTYSRSVGSNNSVNDFTLVDDNPRLLEEVKSERSLTYSRGDKIWKYVVIGPLENADLWKNKMALVLSTFNDNQTYTALFKCLSSSNVITLNKQLLINKWTDLNLLYDILSIRYETYEHAYRLIITDIIILQYSGISVELPAIKNFLIKEKESLENRLSTSLSYNLVLKYAKNVNVSSKMINFRNIPYSIEYNKYCIYIRDINGGKLYNYNNNYLLVKELDQYIYVDVYKDINMAKFLFKYVDLIFDRGFIRNIANFYMYIENNNIIYTETDNLLTKKKIISKYEETKSDFYLNTKIMTFDFECYREYINDKDYKLLVYACGFYDGRKSRMYYITDYNSLEEMIKECLFDMMAKRYKGYKVYVHNLGGFDSIYLINEIPKYFKDVDIISKDNQIISITIKTKNYNIENKKHLVDIVFRDSLRLLPTSLRSLGIEFESSTKKGFFPYSFVQSDVLNYIGNIPSETYFEDNDRKEPDFIIYYNSFKEKEWNLKSETLNYLKADLITLHNVLSKFNKNIFRSFNINPTNNITLSALSMTIYRKHYLKSSKIFIIDGEIHDSIRKAYYGGLSNVYKPYYNRLKEKDDLYYYDVNSLYPYAMLKGMPIGNPIHSTNKDLNKIFGYVNAKIIADENVKIPILPTRNEDGSLLLARGEWNGWYFSEELKNAEKYGYKIEIIESYIFDKDYNLFEEFVRVFYELKKNSVKSEKLIYKLILNSLYGRFGMNVESDIMEFVTPTRRNEILLAYPVHEIIPITKDIEFIKYKRMPDKLLCVSTNTNYYKLLLKAQKELYPANTSVAIAAAISSYARIYMSKFLTTYYDSIYYSDTDSLVLTKSLPDSLINDEIGNMKLVHKNIDNAFFIAPKVYYLGLSNSKNNNIKKAKTIDSEELTLKDYLELYNGVAIKKYESRWYSNIKNENVIVKNIGIDIHPILRTRNKLFSLSKWVDTSSPVIYYNNRSKLDLIPY